MGSEHRRGYDRSSQFLAASTCTDVHTYCFALRLFFLSHTYTYEYMSRVHLTRRSRVLVLTTPAHPAFAGPHRKGVQVLWVLGLVLVEAPNHGRRNHPPPELPCLPCLVCTHWVYVRTYLFISVFSHNCYEYVRCDVD